MDRSAGRHRPLLCFTALMGVLALVSAVGLVVDDRILVGARIWHKPLKFALSFGLYGGTLAWLHSLLTRGRRTSWWAGTVIAAAGAVELAVIVGQVLRGKRSHFNNETPLDSALFSLMGTTVVVLWLAALVVAVLLFRQPMADPATSWAVRLGSLISLAGLALGFLMTAPTAAQRAGRDPLSTGAHAVGVPEDGPHLPVTGWAATGGDLRIGHFVGMHALQVLPLLALALLHGAHRLPRLAPAAVRLRLVVLSAAGYAALVALVTWQALRGQALTEPDGTTLAAAGVLAALWAVGALAAVTRTGRPPRRAAGAGSAAGPPR
ncbi:hypothetical protein [Streptomyces sp. NPDC089919]|uniref:hypothetical protein n=1 Tax=Streptomyces sp. NPDC089919 TaxID=3155188 RepID=UPI00342FDE4B